MNGTMQAAPIYDSVTFAGSNTFDDKTSAQWWDVARSARTVAERDEAIQMARGLAEADQITARFEALPIVQRYRAAQAREAKEAPDAT